MLQLIGYCGVMPLVKHYTYAFLQRQKGESRKGWGLSQVPMIVCPIHAFHPPGCGSTCSADQRCEATVWQLNGSQPCSAISVLWSFADPLPSPHACVQRWGRMLR